MLFIIYMFNDLLHEITFNTSMDPEQKTIAICKLSSKLGNIIPDITGELIDSKLQSIYQTSSTISTQRATTKTIIKKLYTYSSAKKRYK